MQDEQLKLFLSTVAGDPSLQDQLKKAEDPEVVAAIAKSAGFTISAESLSKIELSDVELEGISGGSSFCHRFSRKNACYD